MEKKYFYFHLKSADPLGKALYKVTFTLLVFCFTALHSQTFPPGFSQVKVGTIYYPTCMVMAPDGRIFCAEKAGKVRVIKNGAVLSTNFLQVAVQQEGERGLGSIALDPDFSSNQYVYIYYTVQGSQVKNRLSRFTANGDVALPGSETILLEIPIQNNIHNGGGMVFGPDGKLYIGIGNDNINAHSQDINSYKGKVLRINKDGSVPAGNPYSGSEAASRVWTYGFRNPWSLAIQPGTGKIFANEVGEMSWEEINDVTISGKNFGWPAAEGNSGNQAFTNPVYTYAHGDGLSKGCGISGGDFFNPPVTNYPAQYTGKYFFIDYCNKWINYIDVATGTQYNFASNLPSALDGLKVGRDGNIYYFSISQNSLYKIIYSNNSAPAITGQPSNVSVPAGQPVTFNVSASGAMPLSYQWQKNSVNIPGANAASYAIAAAQNNDAGLYRAVVSNSIGSATSNAASLTVTAFNANPNATILNPAPGTLYRGGDVIAFSGTATDSEDGTLAAPAFKWIIEFHHKEHVHPGPFIPEGLKSSSFMIPVSGEKSAEVLYRIYLIVTDSKGLTDTAKVDIYPKKSNVTIESDPAGLQALFNDQPVTAVYTSEVVSGMEHAIGVISPQPYNGFVHVFDRWEHGGAAYQSFITNDNDKIFKAVFKNTFTPVSVAEISKEQASILLYPNPNTGSFSFDVCIESPTGEMMSLDVINATGQLIYRRPAKLIYGCVNETVDLLGTITPGVYTLQVKIGNKTQTSRLIAGGK